MKKIIYSIALVALSFTSCTSDLEDQIDDLQEALANSYLVADAIKINHEYSYNTETPINESFSLALSSPNNQTIAQTSNDEDVYYIYVNNSLSFDGNNTFRVSFYYDTDDNEVLTNGDGYNGYMYYSGQNLYEDDIYMSEYDSENSSQYQDLDIVVNSINVETGKISFTVEFDYTSNYNYSEYNTDGKLTATFNGTLNVSKIKPDNSNNNLSAK